jgi:hypothetical protein
VPAKKKPAKQLPPFLETQKLREVHRAAVIYYSATGDRAIFDATAIALEAAEAVEDPATYDVCKTCRERVPKGTSYCSLDCAETDGAIPPK